jgi:hypothetical protein
VSFTREPQIGVSGGLGASIDTLSYPANEILIGVEQDLTDNSGEAGRIRIFDVHLNVDSTFAPGPITLGVAPTLIPPDNTQSLRGLDTTSVVIANAVSSARYGGEDQGPTVNVNHSASRGPFTLRLDASPALDVTGNLYVSVAVTDGLDELEGYVFLRPTDDKVPTVEGLYVVLGTDETGAYLPTAASNFYLTGALSSTRDDLTFEVGGLSGLVGLQLEFRSFYVLQGNSVASQRVNIQTVTVTIVP